MPEGNGPSKCQARNRRYHQARETDCQVSANRRDHRSNLRIYEWQDQGKRRHCRPDLDARRMGRSGLILLDTHVVIWLVSDIEKLSAVAEKRLNNARKEGEALTISCISLWEIALLVEKKRIELGTTLESFLQELEMRFVVLPITAKTCLRILELPTRFPKDPADRIIGATALAEGLTLVTPDGNLLSSQPGPVAR